MRTTLLAALAVVLVACAQSPRVAPRSIPVPVAPTAIATVAAPVTFPRDDAPHDQLTEWWYYTGHLDAVGGASYGFEMVVFQVVRGNGPVGYAAHFAVTDAAAGRFTYDQRSSVGSQIGPTDRFDLTVDGWRMRGANGQDQLSAAMPGYAIDLALATRKPAALHDGDGLVSFGPAGDSYYYSRTRMDVSGILTVGDQALPVTGTAWMDHQWGNFVIAGGGWDWFALQFDDGTELVAQIVRDDDARPILVYGTFVQSDGRTIHLASDQLAITASEPWTSPATGLTYETRWRVRTTDPPLDVDVAAVLPNQELDTRPTTGVAYWEGAVTVRGTHTGRGYVELTGRQR